MESAFRPLEARKSRTLPVLQAGEDDVALIFFLFVTRVRFLAGNAHAESRLVMNFFGQRFGGDAVFFLMAELDQNSGVGLDVKAAGLDAHFFGHGDQLKRIV